MIRQDLLQEQEQKNFLDYVSNRSTRAPVVAGGPVWTEACHRYSSINSPSFLLECTSSMCGNRMFTSYFCLAAAHNRDRTALSFIPTASVLKGYSAASTGDPAQTGGSARTGGPAWTRAPGSGRSPCSWSCRCFWSCRSGKKPLRSISDRLYCSCRAAQASKDNFLQNLF